MTLRALARHVREISQRVDLPRLQYDAAFRRHQLRCGLVRRGVYVQIVSGTNDHAPIVIDDEVVQALAELGDDTIGAWARDQATIEAMWAGRWPGPNNVPPVCCWGASPLEMFEAFMRSLFYHAELLRRFGDRGHGQPKPQLPADWVEGRERLRPWPPTEEQVDRGGGRVLRYHPDVVEAMRKG